MTTTQETGNQATINLSKIECIPPKNTIATINQFILNTTDFINRFAFFSEEKLLYLDENVEKLETQLILLEKKLETIPAEYFANVNTTISQPQTISSPPPPTEVLNNNYNNNSTPGGPPPPPPPPPPPGILAPPPLNLLLKGGTPPPPPPPPPVQNNNNSNPNPNPNPTDGQQQPTGEEAKQEVKNEFPGKILGLKEK